MESHSLELSQIDKYESVIETKIKPQMIAESQKLNEKIALVQQYKVLQVNIEMMKKEKEKPLKTLVNIGSEVYAQAKTNNKNIIYVSVGLGFMVEFTLDEAHTYVENKIAKLNIEIANQNNTVDKIKKDYYSAIHSLEQLKEYV